MAREQSEYPSDATRVAGVCNRFCSCVAWVFGPSELFTWHVADACLTSCAIQYDHCKQDAWLLSEFEAHISRGLHFHTAPRIVHNRPRQSGIQYIHLGPSTPSFSRYSDRRRNQVPTAMTVSLDIYSDALSFGAVRCGSSNAGRAL